MVNLPLQIQGKLEEMTGTFDCYNPQNCMDAKRHFGIWKSPALPDFFYRPGINSGSYRLEGDAAQKEYLRFIPLAGFFLFVVS